MAEAESTNGQKTPSTLRSHADHAVAFFVAHFDPQIAYAKKLPNIVEAALKKSKAPHWESTAERYRIRDTNKKYLYHFDHQLFYCQTLGLDPWIANLDDHIEIMSTAFSKMDVTRIKRLSFQVSIQLPLEMSHSELCDLMFGSYLVDREELSTTYGKIDDVLLHLYGNYKGIKTQTTIAPQTVEQSRKSFLSAGNLDAFVEPKFIDTCIKEHYERISKDCLSLIIEMIKEDVPVSALRSSLDHSFEGAEKIADGTVLRIKGLKPKGQVTHGDAREAAN
jgi:hypothetical protein